MKNNEPNNSYWNIFKLTEELLHICEKNDIVIWAEYGSLLGYYRHKGVIPWDYDGDFGIFSKDKPKLIQAFKVYKSNILLDTDFYGDTGNSGLYFEGNFDDVIDIIYYDIKPDRIESMQSETTKINYPCKYNYCYDHNDFYPLEKTLFLGHTIYVPNKIERILKTVYGNWNEYPDEFKHYISEKYLRSPVKQIETFEINNFDNLTKTIENMNSPFIVKNFKLLTDDTEKFKNLIINQKAPIFGYYQDIDRVIDEYPAKDIFEQFISNQLKLNIVDSPVENKSILPQEWKTYIDNKLGENNDYSLTWILTNSPKITHFHTDPHFGGGFMKLIEGEKIWWCVNPVDFKFLTDQGHTVDELSKMNVNEIIRLDHNYLFGKLYVGKIADGDLIWFPINCLHKVITTKSSYGFGGYL